MNSTLAACTFFALAALAACNQSSGPSPAPSASASASASPSPSPSPSTPTPTPTSTPPSTWTGTYKSAAAPLYVPKDVPNAKDWGSVKWRGDDAGSGLGEGSLTLTVDPANHRVTGAIEGPLGPALVEGSVTDQQLAATITRKDPTDRGFTGTAVASVTADKIEGTMRLALADANVIRLATFTLAKK